MEGLMINGLIIALAVLAALSILLVVSTAIYDHLLKFPFNTYKKVSDDKLAALLQIPIHRGER